MRPPLELVPSQDDVFHSVHKQNGIPDVVAGAPVTPCHIQRRGNYLSVLWGKYCPPACAKARCRVPEDNGVIKLSVRKVRELRGLRVEHDPVCVEHAPVDHEIAHTELRFRVPPGSTEKKEWLAYRNALSRVAEWALGL